MKPYGKMYFPSVICTRNEWFLIHQLHLSRFVQSIDLVQILLIRQVRYHVYKLTNNVHEFQHPQMIDSDLKFY